MLKRRVCAIIVRARLNAKIALVNPAPVFVLLLLVAHVHFEFLAQLGAPPFVVLKLPTIRKRPTSQVNVPEEHTAHVREVADAGAGVTIGSDKFNESHDYSEPFHLHGNDHVEVNDSFGEKHSASENQSENRSRATNGRSLAGGLEQNTKQTSPYAGQEKVHEKPFASPGALEVRSKNPQGIQIEENVEPSAMNEKVCDQLPGIELMNNQPGDQSKVNAWVYL